MEEQMSLLGSFGIPETKKVTEKVAKKQIIKLANKHRSLEEILSESILNLENDQCPRCGNILDSVYENKKEFLICSSDKCDFRMLEEYRFAVIEKARAL